MEFDGFIYVVFDCDLYADAGAFLDVLIRGVLNIGNYMFDPHIILSNSYFLTNDGLQVFEDDKLAIDFNIVWVRIATNIVKNAHIWYIYGIYYVTR